MKTNSNEWKAYTRWLISKVDYRFIRYSKLFNYLNTIPFIFDNTVKYDENRASDGVYQRGYFFEHEEDFEDIPCTVLEMLSSFTVRCGEYIGYGSDGFDHFEWIFKAFLGGSGLISFDNPRFDKEKVDEKLDFWMKRKYGDDGKGSIFPLKTSYRGYNREEIWRQMNIFIGDWEISNLDFFEHFEG